MTTLEAQPDAETRRMTVSAVRPREFEPIAAITGWGLVTALGGDSDTSWSAINGGRHITDHAPAILGAGTEAGEAAFGESEERPGLIEDDARRVRRALENSLDQAAGAAAEVNDQTARFGQSHEFSEERSWIFQVLNDLNRNDDVRTSVRERHRRRVEVGFVEGTAVGEIVVANRVDAQIRFNLAAKKILKGAPAAADVQERSAEWPPLPDD